VYDTANAIPPVKLTFDAHNVLPVWTRDGRQIVFQSSRSTEREACSRRWPTEADWSRNR